MKGEIDKKVGFTKFDDSIQRVHNERENGDRVLHERLTTHISTDGRLREKLSNDVSYIKGRIETFLKNGGAQPDAR